MESICCEIYGTGKANLPGSVVERELQESMSRMFPELLRFSSSFRLLPLVPEELRDAHRIDKVSNTVTTVNSDLTSNVDLWDEWADNRNTVVTFNANAYDEENEDDDDDVDLSAMGL